jgi:heat shock protein HtpX
MRYRFRLALLAIACCLAFGVAGYVFGLPFQFGIFGFFMGAFAGGAYYFFGTWSSEQFLLDIYSAYVVDAITSPNLYNALRKLASDAGIDQPLLYAIPQVKPNAFAAVRADRSSVVVLTESLMEHLEHDEVRAILALMVARIAQSDAAACSVAATLTGVPLAGATSFGFRDYVRAKFPVDAKTGVSKPEATLLAILGPVAAWSMRTVFDRGHFSEADAMAARVTSSGALGSALSKIDVAKPDEWWGKLSYNPATALLFAVPPMADPALLDPSSKLIVRSQSAFASIVPTVEERCARLAGFAGSLPADSGLRFDDDAELEFGPVTTLDLPSDCQQVG